MIGLHHMIAARQLTTLSLVEQRAWPAGAEFRRDDIIVDGVSLTAVGAESTPAVRIGLRRGAVGGGRRFMSLVVTRVTRVSPPSGAAVANVYLDADLEGRSASLADLQLIGRVPSRRRSQVRLHLGSHGPGALVRLPRDLTEGDLLVVPCEGALPLAGIRAHTAPPDDDEFHCSRHMHR